MAVRAFVIATLAVGLAGGVAMAVAIWRSKRISVADQRRV
jgi:hypothetical protein